MCVTDQTGPDSGAQLGAQFDDKPPESRGWMREPVMSETCADLQTLLRVLNRHAVTNQQLANQSNRDAGYISRVLAGQFDIPLTVYIAAWRMTRDEELLTILSLRDRHVVAVTDELHESVARTWRAFSRAPGALPSRLDVLG